MLVFKSNVHRWKFILILALNSYYLNWQYFIEYDLKESKFLDQASPSSQIVDQPCNQEIKPCNQEIQPCNQEN